MKRLWRNLSVFLILVSLNEFNGEMFTSLGEMTNLAQSEIQIAQQLQEFLDSFMLNVEKAKGYAILLVS